MKAKRLPSGKWRIRVYLGTFNGVKKYKSITHELKSQCEYLASLEITNHKNKDPEELTVGECIDRYIEISEVLEPDTIEGYEKIRKYAFKHLMDIPVNQLTDESVQVAINLESKRLGERTHKPISPKTVKNEWGLISAALKTMYNKSFNIRLPKVQHKNEVLPEPVDIINLIKGTKVELPVMLAIGCSLRMSEVRGLSCSDVHDNILFINKAMVDVHNIPTLKQYAKTDSSIRKVQLSNYILTLIKNTDTYKEYTETGVDRLLIPMTRNQIYHYYTRILKKNGIDISFHDLRHEFASVSLNILNQPARVVKDAGGWKTDYVMNRIYSQSFDKLRQKSDTERNAFFDEMTQG